MFNWTCAYKFHFRKTFGGYHNFIKKRKQKKQTYIKKMTIAPNTKIESPTWNHLSYWASSRKQRHWCCHPDTDYIQTMMIVIGVEISAFIVRESKKQIIPFDRTKCVDLFEKSSIEQYCPKCWLYWLIEDIPIGHFTIWGGHLSRSSKRDIQLTSWWRKYGKQNVSN